MAPLNFEIILFQFFDYFLFIAKRLNTFLWWLFEMSIVLIFNRGCLGLLSVFYFLPLFHLNLTVSSIYFYSRALSCKNALLYSHCSFAQYCNFNKCYSSIQHVMNDAISYENSLTYAFLKSSTGPAAILSGLFSRGSHSCVWHCSMHYCCCCLFFSEHSLCTRISP